MYTMKKNICKARERHRMQNKVQSGSKSIWAKTQSFFFASVHHHSEFEMKHGVIELQTFRTILYVDPHFKGFGWIKFLWSLWLSEVKSPWTSLNAVFPLLGCSARSSAAAYLWAFLHSVLYLITGKHALLDWDHMTQLAIEKNPLLFLEKLLLLL